MSFGPWIVKGHMPSIYDGVLGEFEDKDTGDVLFLLNFIYLFSEEFMRVEYLSVFCRLGDALTATFTTRLLTSDFTP